MTTSIAKRLAAACCRASFVAAHLYFSWRLRRFVSVTLIGVQLDCAVDHKPRAIVKMVGAHDSRLVSPWHLRFKRRATAGSGLAYTNALWASITLWAKAPSQPQPHLHADISIDKADDHGVNVLLPVRVLPVFSVVGLE